jgi:hypothetical protein
MLYHNECIIEKWQTLTSGYTRCPGAVIIPTDTPWIYQRRDQMPGGSLQTRTLGYIRWDQVSEGSLQIQTSEYTRVGSRCLEDPYKYGPLDILERSLQTQTPRYTRGWSRCLEDPYKHKPLNIPDMGSGVWRIPTETNPWIYENVFAPKWFHPCDNILF